ncbi:MAG: acyltransferase domain-containing protein, partial [Actinomycetota bacterium]|nr:acyltransferase domain-containing protein [Actinomycetota bacterium]
VGEITAAALAGALTPAAAVAFAARRGAEMAAACALTPTGMTAVLGGDPDEVIATITRQGLAPANRNGAGQVVAAGSVSALQALAADPPSGARIRPLAVAGAFHTHYMHPAEDALAEFSQGLSAQNPRCVLLSNADGAATATGHGVLGRLVRQITRPVRWDLCQQSLRELGVTAVIELPPAGTLAGLAKRELPGVQVIALKSPADLAAAQALVDDRPQHGQGEHTVDFQVVVSPAKGVFTRSPGVAEGSTVAAGARLATITTNRDEHPVIAPTRGPLQLTEWLRHDGDIVAAGLAVARLQPGSDY